MTSIGFRVDSMLHYVAGNRRSLSLVRNHSVKESPGVGSDGSAITALLMK